MTDVAVAATTSVPAALPEAAALPAAAAPAWGDPLALGLASFGISALVLAAINSGWIDATATPGVLVHRLRRLLAVLRAAGLDLPASSGRGERPGQSAGGLVPAGLVNLHDLHVAGLGPHHDHDPDDLRPADGDLLAPDHRHLHRQYRAEPRTRKAQPVKLVPALKLAGNDSWQAARLFSISGVGASEEQEKRATSTLLASMLAVRPFARGITSRFGAPSGIVETFLEVGFPLGERTVYPDGVIRIARAGKIWTGLLETKTGDGQLRRDQVENYLDVAWQQGFDAVITLSNEIAPTAGRHPVEFDQRKLRNGKVQLHHISWAEVLHEARMVVAHKGADNQLQLWIIAELIRTWNMPSLVQLGSTTWARHGCRSAKPSLQERIGHPIGKLRQWPNPGPGSSAISAY